MSDTFYNGNRLCTMKDIDGYQPQFFLVTGNRTAGKTFYFKRKIVNRFIKHKEQFAVLVRFQYQLDDFAEDFFEDIGSIEFINYHMTDKAMKKGLIRKLFINNEHCGYALAINNADPIKAMSGMFVGIKHIFLDEFISETNKYVPDEMTKLQSILTSISRGGGKHYRYVPVYMAANRVTDINPIYMQFGIHRRLSERTKFIKGPGWVLEKTYNQAASSAIEDSPLGRAFKGTRYLDFSTKNQELKSYMGLIEKMKGDGKLLYIFVDGTERFGIWEMSKGLLYVSHKNDIRWKRVYVFRTEDQKVDTIMLRSIKEILNMLKHYYDFSNVRFEDVACRNSFIEFIGLGLY